MRERNPYLVVALVLLLGMTLLMYWTKYNVAQLDNERRTLEMQLSEEREALRVLRAEWAHLNRPERLRRLAGEYLELAEPAKGARVISSAMLPEIADVPVPYGKPVHQKQRVIYSRAGDAAW